MNNNVEDKTEELRKKLRDDVYAMTFSGLPAALLDLDEIENADAEDLEALAKRYGYK